MYQKVNDKVNIPWGEVVTASLQFQGFQVRSCDLKKISSLMLLYLNFMSPRYFSGNDFIREKEGMVMTLGKLLLCLTLFI